MSLYDKPKITRTVEVNDLTPRELAELFCDMFNHDQAKFFSEVWNIAKAWPGSGWCHQSYEIVRVADAGALDAIKAIAAHVEAGA